MIKFTSPLDSLLETTGPKPTIWESIVQTERVSLIALIAGNLIPVVVALVFGWNVGDVAICYWWENVIIGIYSVLRIALAKAGGSEMAPMKWFLVPFFCFHYFFFCFIHLIFLRVIFDPDLTNGASLGGIGSHLAAILPPAAMIGILALAVSHGVSFYRNYIEKKEYESTVAFLEMFRPYGRIVLLHVCIIAGGALMMWLGSSAPLVILLMLGKTVLDVITHSASHAFSRRLAEAKAIQDAVDEKPDD